MCLRRTPPILPSDRRAWPARLALSIPPLAAGLLSALGLGAAALRATPIGSQFQVSTYTTNRQQIPSVAVDADGDFVVVWDSGGSAGGDTSGYSIQGQRYHAPAVPTLCPPGLITLAVLLLGVGTLSLKARPGFPS